MKEIEIKFLEESFKKYYFDHSELLNVLERTPEREFGYQKFNSGMTRHISIKNDKEALVVKKIMETSIPLKITNKVTYKRGENWGTIKK